MIRIGVKHGYYPAPVEETSPTQNNNRSSTQSPPSDLPSSKNINKIILCTRGR
ncbi:16990_t:CDS:2 [Entrophospora sp. SA101]|nr:16990_t:CDS:2 [Entrophospora sp. SA101]